MKLTKPGFGVDRDFSPSAQRDWPTQEAATLAHQFDPTQIPLKQHRCNLRTRQPPSPASDTKTETHDRSSTRRSRPGLLRPDKPIPSPVLPPMVAATISSAVAPAAGPDKVPVPSTDAPAIPSRRFTAADLPLPSATRAAIESLAHSFKKKGGYDDIRKEVWVNFEASVSSRSLLRRAVSAALSHATQRAGLSSANNQGHPRSRRG
jgi:COMPASS (Complex protein associated with Set1p) component shg1